MGTSSRLPRIAVVLLFSICISSFGLMYYTSLGDAAIQDELAHIPAGYGYVHELDYRLNPEHPPLIKALAMAPVLLLHPDFPVSSPAWTSEINSQWDMGGDFLYGSGNDADQIIRVARIFPILLTIGLILLMYAWAEEFLGPYWALLPSILFGLSPTILAHGHYLTTDIGATFGFIIATYFFLKFLKNPSARHLIYAGLTFGIAEITKFSTVLTIPYFLMLITIWYAASVIRDWRETKKGFRLKRFGIRAWRYFRATVFIFVIGYIVIVYPAYFFFTLHYPIPRQVNDTTFLLGSFANGPTPAGQSCHFMRCIADLDIWMSGHTATRPFAQYLLGVLMALQRVDGGNTIYFLGHVVNAGGWTYFPLLYALKEPIPSLIVVGVALILALRSILKKFRAKEDGIHHHFEKYVLEYFTEFSMILFVVFYWAYSMRSPLNIGIRHIIPTLPFIYMLAAIAWKKWFELPALSFSFISFFAWWKSVMKLGIKFVFLMLLILWFAGETAFATPYFLSYFNEFGGGTWNGYHYVTDSNYDWGQDLLRLKNFVGSHPEIDKIAVDYFGGGNPGYYLGEKAVGWRSSHGSPSVQGIHWLAVSINSLEGATQPLGPGRIRNPQDEYRWLTQIRPPAPGLGNVPDPDFKAGTSIFIYHL